MTRAGRWLGDHLILLIGLLVLLYMFMPIFVVMLMSFNDPASRNSYSFDGFTLRQLAQHLRARSACASPWSPASQIGLLATLLATLLGTLMAFAMVRHRFHGRARGEPVHVPADGDPRDRDGLLAAGAVRQRRLRRDRWGSGRSSSPTCCSACRSWWSRSRPGWRGSTRASSRRRWTCTPTSGRRSGGSASRWCSRASWPPRCCRFSLSFDDFIITNLNAGQEVTFPMFVWGAAQRGIPPQINVVGTIMFLVAMGVVLGGELGNRRNRATPSRRSLPGSGRRVGAVCLAQDAESAQVARLRTPSRRSLPSDDEGPGGERGARPPEGSRQAEVGVLTQPPDVLLAEHLDRPASLLVEPAATGVVGRDLLGGGVPRRRRRTPPRTATPPVPCRARRSRDRSRGSGSAAAGLGKPASNQRRRRADSPSDSARPSARGARDSSCRTPR